MNELGRLLDRAGEPIYALDDERRIVFFNQAASDWTGYPAEEMLGQECRYHAGFELDGPAKAACALAPPPDVGSGSEVVAQVACPARDGRLRCRQVRFVPVRSSAGQVEGVLAWVGGEEVQLPAEPVETGNGQADGCRPVELHLVIQQLRHRFGERYHVDRLLGTSPAIACARAQAALAAASTASVLIFGPTGSGRQHLARAIHYSANTATGAPLVPLACSVLGGELLRSAIAALGRVDVGSGRATLLLNEVDQLVPQLQAELPGLLHAVASRVRLMATARQPLVPLARRGEYHQELAAALSTLVIELPPLAERMEDLPLLAQLFLEQANARRSKQVGRLTDEALDRLAGYGWPGNLDELDEVVQAAHEKAQGHEITGADLPRKLHFAADAAAHRRPQEEKIVLETFLAEIERELIQRAMKQAKGNKTKAAELLGMTRPKLYRRLVQLGLE